MSMIDYSFADKDAMKLYLWVKGTSNVREPTVTKISEIVAAELE
jgi:hypothetical protein